ncbi:MAG: hypothetical protein ACYTGV_01080 [Planctomycetota bacterium]|jgi:hypothetical protein
MRLLTLGVLALLLLGAILFLFTLFGLPEVHVSALVPDDAKFVIGYSSINELRELYEGPAAPLNFDPALSRIGRQVNNPGFDGIDFEQAVASYVTQDGKEVHLVPFVEFDAFEKAFALARDNIHLRGPFREARNYLSTSKTGARPERGPEDPLVRQLDEHVLLLAGRPESALDLRFMLTYLLSLDDNTARVTAPLLSRVVTAIPEGAAGFVATECDDLLLGIPRGQKATDPLRIVVRATPRARGALARAEEVARQVDLARLVGSIPRAAGIVVGGVLDAKGWDEIGVALPLGDGAVAAGIVERKYHGRPYTLLVAASPRDPKDLDGLRALGPALLSGSEALEFTAEEDEGTEVRTAVLDAPPARLRTILHASQKVPPPVYLSTAVEKGVWYCAIGSQAEHTVRSALGCLRGAAELSVRGAEGVQAHREFFRAGHAAMALVTPEGLKSLRFPMPYVQIANVGQPKAVTFVLDVAGMAQGDLRLAR